jgi:hypothetical protein
MSFGMSATAYLLDLVSRVLDGARNGPGQAARPVDDEDRREEGEEGIFN